MKSEFINHVCRFAPEQGAQWVRDYLTPNLGF
jgi:hypothetical protein